MSTNHESFAVTNPIPYNGETPKPNTPKDSGINCSIVEAANYYNLPQLLERYGEWIICDDGIHCLYTDYFIEKSRLSNDDWVSHVTEKSWVVASDFTAAFERAKEMFEIAEES